MQRVLASLITPLTYQEHEYFNFFLFDSSFHLDYHVLTAAHNMERFVAQSFKALWTLSSCNPSNHNLTLTTYVSTQMRRNLQTTDWDLLACSHCFLACLLLIRNGVGYLGGKVPSRKKLMSGSGLNSFTTCYSMSQEISSAAKVLIITSLAICLPGPIRTPLRYGNISQTNQAVEGTRLAFKLHSAISDLGRIDIDQYQDAMA